MLSVTDALERTTKFKYDGAGNVIETTDALNNKTVYTYDDNGNRKSETRWVTTPDGVEEVVTEWVYDKEGRMLSMTDALDKETKYEYDDAGNQVAVIDALSRRTESVYDEKGQLVETIYPDDTPNNPDDNYRTISVYDKGGRLGASIDESGRVTHYRYDAVGQLVETIYPDEVDGLAQFVAAVAPGETVETVDWSQVVYPEGLLAFLNDNPSSKTEYDESGRVKAEIDELGNRVEFRYDDAGRLVETIYPDDTPGDLSDNPRSSTEYDNAGRRVKDIDAEGRVTEFVYDDLGRVKETLLADGTSTETVYDDAGQKVADIDQEDNRTEYEYDDLGRLTDVVQFLEGREIRTEYGYDELGRQIWQEDANDNRTLFDYDLMGRRTDVVLPMMQRSTTFYDAVGNAERTIDFNGETTTYRYDEQNRLEFIDLFEDPDVTYTYTPTGQRETVTDGRGVTSYVYDVRERLIGRTDPTGEYLASGATIEYKYDDAGNRTLVRTPGGETEYKFDERNRLEKVIDADGGETVYKYDDVGNLVETVLPNGVVETREYDELNRLEFLENKSGGVVVSSYDYELDDVGNRISVTEHDGRKVEYKYDDLYRLESENINDRERVIGYSYDDVGNRLEKVDSVEGTTTYRYDDNDQLREENSNGEVVVYEYDDNGNTISETVNGVEQKVYIWDDRNRLVEVRFADGKVVTYGYDDGNIRVSEVVDGVETRFLLDKNRPYAQVLEEYVDGALDAEYVYGRDLISQTREGVDSFYFVDGLGSTRGLTDVSGGVVASYTYDAFGNLVRSSGDVENDYLFAGEQFDENLDQYYLRQRYYDQGVGRFTRRDVYEGELNQPITLHKYLYGNANPVNYIDPSGFISSSSEFSAANSIQNELVKIYVEMLREVVNVSASYLPGGQSIVATLAIIDALSLIGDLPDVIESIKDSIGLLKPERKLSLIEKHLPGTPKSLKVLKTDGSTHVFNDRGTMDDVTKQLMDKGQYRGFSDGFHRFELEFPNSIGKRHSANGTTQDLKFAELKIREDGHFHVVPRNSPRRR